MELQTLLTGWLENVARKIEQDFAQIARCARLLSHEQLWHRVNRHCNAVGNLVVPLDGNVREWILGGVAGQAVSRNRPDEFSPSAERSLEQALSPLESTVRRACEVIRGLGAPELAIVRTIQAYTVTTLDAVFHVAEHFSFHTGQIVHMTTALRDVDLSLYDDAGRSHRDSVGLW